MRTLAWVDSFGRVAILDPSRAVAWVNLGDSLQRQGQAGRARQAFTTYLALAPKGASADHARQARGEAAH